MNIISKGLVTAFLAVSALGSYAQNKDVDKGKELLTKAFDQTDNVKRGEIITKAREAFTKGGLKPQEVAVLIGDGYLGKKDYTNAATAYSSASKEEKKVGFKKLAYLQVDDAFQAADIKAETKLLKSAISFFTKADALKEGARAIGDKFFDRGADSYPKALEYYQTANAADKISTIAEAYEAKGADGEMQAAETYKLAKTPESFKKAGDIYYAKKEYGKAFDAYQSGNVVEGIIKYANHLVATGQNVEADNLYNRVADAFAEKENKAGLIKLADDLVSKHNYGTAVKLYNKAGEDLKANKYSAYEKLGTMDFEEAKALFTTSGDAAMAKAITDNTKQLAPLKDIYFNLQSIRDAQPNIGTETDATTGETKPNKDDVKSVADHYKTSKDQIVGQVYLLSTTVPKITNAELKKLIMEQFLSYPAVASILNKETFAIKLQKPQISVKDVYLK